MVVVDYAEWRPEGPVPSTHVGTKGKERDPKILKRERKGSQHGKDRSSRRMIG